MKNSFILSPSILSADFSILGSQISEVESAGVDCIHIDVMDGQFVPNITMGSFIVETCKKITDLPIETHLMIEHPERHIDSFFKAGARRIGVHIESNPNIYRTLQYIRSLGCECCITINPGTPVSSLTNVLDIVDQVLVMTVNPGFSGQEFIPETLPKISDIYKMLQKIQSNALIQVDGGITEKTLPLAYKAGARNFVAATSIFKYPGGIKKGVDALRQSISQKEKKTTT